MEDIKPSENWLLEKIETQDVRMGNIESIIHTEQLERVKSTYSLEQAIENGVRKGLSPLEERVVLLETQVHEILHKPAFDALAESQKRKDDRRKVRNDIISTIIKVISPGIIIAIWEVLKKVNL